MRTRNPNGSRFVDYISKDRQTIELIIRGSNLTPDQFKIVRRVCVEAKEAINERLQDIIFEDPEEVYVNLNFSETY